VIPPGTAGNGQSSRRDAGGSRPTSANRTLTFLQIFQALATRSNTESLLRIGLFSNRTMLLAIAVVVLLQLAGIYIPTLSTVFLNTLPLTLFDLAVAAGAGLVLFIVIELEKLVRRGQKVAPWVRQPSLQA
jgi:magnesium-transporting ATPase (P-type)